MLDCKKTDDAGFADCVISCTGVIVLSMGMDAVCACSVPVDVNPMAVAIGMLAVKLYN